MVARLTRITKATAPDMIAVHGVGPDTASTLLISAGDNPHRLHSESSWAALLGSNPIPASSGKTTRHRLNRGGDRQANAALWRSPSSGCAATRTRACVDGHVIPQGWRHAMPHGVRVWKLLRGGLLGVV